MAKDFITRTMWKCLSCENEFRFYSDAQNCCPPKQFNKYVCEFCGKEGEGKEIQEIKKCCSDDMKKLIDEVRK